MPFTLGPNFGRGTKAEERNAITSVELTITLEDGSTSSASIGYDAGWQQWGASTERLGLTVEAVDAMAQALDQLDALATTD